MTDAKRTKKIVNGTLLKTINEKKNLIAKVEKMEYERPREIKRIIESITFGEAVDRTIEYLKELAIKSDAIDMNTVHDYYYRAKKYVTPFFKSESKLSKINEDKVKEFVSYMFNRDKARGTGKVSIDTVEKAYSTLRWVIRYCSEISNPPLLEENCLNNIRFKHLIPKGRGKNQKRNKNHSPAEIDRLKRTLLAKANIRLKTMILTLIDVGCRNEECSALKWKNVNLITGEIEYKNALTSGISKEFSLEYSGPREKVLKSPQSYRKNYLTPTTLKCLNNYREFKINLGISVEDDDFIFTIWDSNKVLSPDSFSDEFMDFRKKYGFENIPPYDMRHTLSNDLLDKNVHPKDVATYMGNTARTLVENYTHSREDKQLEIKNIIMDRNQSQKFFDIDTIVDILNYNGEELNSNGYNLLDFLTNSNISVDDLSWAIPNAKQLILNQYPILESFCNDDYNIVKAKVETYKDFNQPDIELVQDSAFFNRNISL